MFESFKNFYFEFKKFINYISCKLLLNKEEPYYEQLPEEDIRDVL